MTEFPVVANRAKQSRYWERNAMPLPLSIRVVVVTMYEPSFETAGEPEGAHFGEFRLWVDGLPLIERIAFPYGFRELRHHPEKGVLGIVTGVGTARAAASIMALGMDPRFDLSRTYWLIAGIAGVNPHQASIGSAAWVEWVVDTDLAFAIDAREIPADWPTFYLPFGKTRPYELPIEEDAQERSVYRLDASLVEWAYRLTADMKLADTPALQAARARYFGFPAAQTPPAVIRGDEASGSTFWHGELLNRHATEWLRYWTRGRGRFVMTAMEETGTLQALTFLARAGRTDFRRVLVLRTASNYSMQPPGVGAAESLRAETLGEYSGYRPALDAAYVVGRRVVDELTDNWPNYADAPPFAA
jgi:purine nucleoside permease